jgi:acyl-coenzyme A thioesterase PaaI-like protein
MSERALPVEPIAPSPGVVVPIEPHACFGCGDQNEIGLQLRIHHVSGGCWAELEIPDRFQGWEGVSHGGIVSTILDEVMTWSLIERDLWGVTARLTVEFKRPVLIGRRIRAEGRLVDVRRRVVTASARLLEVESGLELASAKATFVAADEAKKRLLKERYGDLAARRAAAEREAAQAAGAGSLAALRQRS